MDKVHYHDTPHHDTPPRRFAGKFNYFIERFLADVKYRKAFDRSWL
jgi:hypothetical protein